MHTPLEPQGGLSYPPMQCSLVRLDPQDTASCRIILCRFALHQIALHCIMDTINFCLDRRSDVPQINMDNNVHHFMPLQFLPMPSHSIHAFYSKLTHFV